MSELQMTSFKAESQPEDDDEEFVPPPRQRRNPLTYLWHLIRCKVFGRHNNHVAVGDSGGMLLIRLFCTDCDKSLRIMVMFPPNKERMH